MKNHIYPYITLLISLFILTGCSVKWTKAIRYGEIAQKGFEESVDIEVHKGLIIVPVTMHGKTFRFLFDTGAPFSISEELQLELNFKVISKGNIIDSDHNRKPVNWVSVDEISLGSVDFLNLSAFVGDFKANPILKCLEIDGIIGSNLMRHCNWTIDQENHSLSLFDSMNKKEFNNTTVIPFRKDQQFNIFTNVDFGKATVNNVLVDYGSNGSITLSNKIFNLLKEKKLLDKPITERGVKQSGIVGNAVAIKREFVHMDSISLWNLGLNNVHMQSGKTTAIGTSILSRFEVTIDWEKQQLMFQNQIPDKPKNGYAGFKLGYAKEKGVYVLSVIENSNADKAGIKHDMTIVRIGSLDFDKNADFCDYVNYKLNNTIYIRAIDSSGIKQDYNFEKTYF
jgi:hypothetical protein